MREGLFAPSVPSLSVNNRRLRASSLKACVGSKGKLAIQQGMLEQQKHLATANLCQLRKFGTPILQSMKYKIRLE